MIERNLSFWVLVFSFQLFVFSSCRPRQNQDSIQKDTVIRSKPAWFVGGDQVINFCVKTTPEVEARIRSAGLTTPAELTGLAFRTYGYWIAYMVQKGVQQIFTYNDAIKLTGVTQPATKIYDVHIVEIEERLNFNWPSNDVVSASDIKKSFPVAMSFVLNCEDADLEVHYGTQPDSSFISEPEESSVLGSVYTSNVQSRHHPQWRRGAIVLKNQGDSFEYGDFVEPEFVLMHEWGHVLGVPHVPGTIMDTDVIKNFSNHATDSRIFSAGLRVPLYIFSVTVDRWRQLVLCEKVICKNFGISLSTLLGNVDVSDQRGVDSFEFQYFSVYGSSNPRPKISRDLGEVIKKIEVPIAEVFRRDPSFGANPILHKSISIERWYNKKNLTKAVLNGNAPHTSPVTVSALCSPNSLNASYVGKTINLFKAAFVNNVIVTQPVTWNKIGEKTPLLKTREFRDCTADESIIPEAKYLDLDKQQEQFLNAHIMNVKKGSIKTIGGPFVKVFNLPVKNTYCDNSIHVGQLCLFKKDDLALLRIGNASNTTMAVIAPLLNESLPEDGRLKHGWNGVLKFEVPGFEEGEFEFRFGIDQEFGDTKNIKYELDILTFAGVWINAFSGTLQRLAD